MYFAFKTYPGGGAFALFFHPHPREFATQNKRSANARGLARGGGGEWAQLELTDALTIPFTTRFTVTSIDFDPCLSVTLYL